MSYARISSVVALSLLGAIAVPASASMTSIEGNLALSTEGLADFTGFLDYQFLGGNQGQLTVTLTNTTDPSVGGYLTAFMFRTPESFGGFTSSLVSSTYAAMTDIPAGSNGSPFPGVWLGGAGLGASWLSGGSPNDGVAVGSTGQWVFSITGAMASGLDAADFVDGDAYAFIVRFRGLTDGGSDKVPASTPAPGALVLGAMGLAFSRRRRD
jgi:MYXO-CTERM domain-containing protein